MMKLEYSIVNMNCCNWISTSIFISAKVGEKRYKIIIKFYSEIYLNIIDGYSVAKND